jgi:hypothetical protein
MPPLYLEPRQRSNAPSFLVPISNRNESRFHLSEIVSKIAQRETQLWFLQTAVYISINYQQSQQTESIQKVVIELCMDPRNLRLFKRLLAQNLHSVQMFGQQLLVPAVEQRNRALVSTLLESGADPFCDSIEHQTSGLGMAALQGDVDIVKEILRLIRNTHKDRHTQFNLKHRTFRDCFWVPLKQTINLKNLRLLEVFEEMLSKDTFSLLVQEHAKPLTNAAACSGSILIVDFLLSRMDVNFQGYSHILEAALALAAYHGHYQVVSELIRRGANINAEIPDTWCSTSPLNNAVRNGHNNMVKLLLEQNANPNNEPGNGGFPIQIAAANGYGDIVSMLLKAGADPNVYSKPIHPSSKEIRPALQLAMESGATNIFFELIEHRASISAPSPASQSLLWSAMYGKCRKIIDFILSTHDISYLRDDYETFTLCVMHQDLDVIETLVDLGAELNNPSALCAAISRGDHRVIQYLIDGIFRRYGKLPVQYGAAGIVAAAQTHDLELLQRFLRLGVKPFEVVNEEIQCPYHKPRPSWTKWWQEDDKRCCMIPTGSTWLSNALKAQPADRNRMLHCFKLLLLSYDEEVDGVLHRESYKRAISIALAKAVYVEERELTNMLFERGASCFVAEEHMSALRIAVKKKDYELVEYFLQNSPEIREKNSHALEDIVEAIDEASLDTNNVDLVRLLLEYRSVLSSDPRPLGEHAPLFADEDMLALLLDHKFVVDHSAIRTAVVRGDLDIVKMLLLDSEVDISEGFSDGKYSRTGTRYLLDVAAKFGYLDLAKFLLEMGMKVEGRENRIYRLAVFRAVQSGYMAVARMILDYKTEKYGPQDCYSLTEIMEYGEAIFRDDCPALNHQSRPEESSVSFENSGNEDEFWPDQIFSSEDGAGISEGNSDSTLFNTFLLSSPDPMDISY